MGLDVTAVTILGIRCKLLDYFDDEEHRFDGKWRNLFIYQSDYPEKDPHFYVVFALAKKDGPRSFDPKELPELSFPTEEQREAFYRAVYGAEIVANREEFAQRFKIHTLVEISF